jgi:hypothetical protein
MMFRRLALANMRLPVNTFFKILTASIAFGACIYLLYYGVLWASLDMSPRSVSYDQRLRIEEIGYWVFMIGSVIGGVVYWKVLRD